MHPMLKNVIAVVLGLVIGGLLNGGLIQLGPMLIPPPDGVDFTTEEGLKTSMHLMQPRHFIFPFLAHALGTLAGAFIAAKIAASHQLRLAMVVGIVFFIGGSMMVAMLSAPMWFNITDLALAYLPMAYIGWKLAGKK